MKNYIKPSFRLFLRLIVANIMCFFVILSITLIANTIFTDKVGYTAYVYNEDMTEVIEEYEYYYGSGEDTKKAEFEKAGNYINETPIRSEISKKDRLIYLGFVQIMNLMLLISFVYSDFWSIGNKERNSPDFDKYKGIKCGLLAVSPSVLFLIVSVIVGLFTNVKIPVALINFVNSYFYFFFYLVNSQGGFFDASSILKVFVMLLVQLIIPLIAQVGFTLGKKDILLGEKFVYKKKKV